jgi:Tub family
MVLHHAHPQPQPLAVHHFERLIHHDYSTKLELDSYPLENDEMVQAPHPFAVPTQNYYLRRAGIGFGVRGVARREGGVGSRNDRIVFYLQGIPGVFRTRALFVAQRQLNGSYHIYNIYNDSGVRRNHFSKNHPRYAGKLNRHGQHHGFVDFRLVQGRKGRQTQVSSLIYKASSLKYPVMGGSPNRIAYSIIYNADDHSDLDTVSHHSMTASSEVHRDERDYRKVHPKGPESIDHAAKVALEGKEDGLHSLPQQYKNISVFQSKRCFTNKRGRSIHSNRQNFMEQFGRRVRKASKKNMQMMDACTGSVIFQIGRWDDVEFTVDFLPPYNPYQVFGMVLAQMETS